MTAEMIAAIYHLAAIVLGALAVRQLKRNGSMRAARSIFLLMLVVQFVPTLASYLYSQQPGMIAHLYLTVLLFAPAAVLTTLIWLIVGGISLATSPRST